METQGHDISLAPTALGCIMKNFTKHCFDGLNTIQAPPVDHNTS